MVNSTDIPIIPMTRKLQDTSSAMNFTEGADRRKRWSDVFAMAKALGHLAWDVDGW